MDIREEPAAAGQVGRPIGRTQIVPAYAFTGGAPEVQINRINRDDIYIIVGQAIAGCKGIRPCIDIQVIAANPTGGREIDIALVGGDTPYKPKGTVTYPIPGFVIRVCPTLGR